MSCLFPLAAGNAAVAAWNDAMDVLAAPPIKKIGPLDLPITRPEFDAMQNYAERLALTAETLNDALYQARRELLKRGAA